MLLRLRRSRLSRTTVKFVGVAPETDSSPVWMFSTPTLKGPTQPDSRPHRHALSVLQTDATTIEKERGLASRVWTKRRDAPERQRPDVLEEEFTLLREEQTEPGQIDLLLVRFHLSEVGIDRQVL